MARKHRLNTAIVLAAVHGLSGLFRAVSAVEPSLFRPLPSLSTSLITHLASVDVKRNGPTRRVECWFTSTETVRTITDGDRRLGGGVGGRKSEGSTADTARKRPERAWNAVRTMEVLKAVSPRHCPATSAPRNCCFSCRAGQSHKDNVRCTAVEEQPEAKEVQLSQPSSTSLLMISSGLT